MRREQKVGRMKILPISDIHGKVEILNHILATIDSDDYDVVVVCGDVWEGSKVTAKTDWVSFQQVIQKPIIMIQGNHDYWDNTIFDDCEDIHLLHNDLLEIDGVKFFGTPYTVNFGGWNWMNSEESLYDMWSDTIPEGIDVLLSHGPPYGHCDNCNQPVYTNDSESKLGSKSLYSVLIDKAPKYVFCGHIHTGDRFKVLNDVTKVYNVSCLDEAYQFMGCNPEPSVIELELE